MHDHVGSVTKFQQRKTERLWTPNSYPTLGNGFCLVKLEIRVVKCIDEEGCTAATHIKHLRRGNLTL